MVESPLAGVLRTDETGTVRYCSDRAAAMFGYREADVQGTKVADLIVADGGPTPPGETRTLAAIGLRRDGVQFPIDLTVVAVKAGATESLVWVVRERADAAAELEDPLTRLPSRAFCFERIRERLEHGQINSGSFATMLVALDGLAELRAHAGGAAADTVLVESASRLRHAVAGADLIGRFDDATFCIIASDASNPADLESLARTVGESIGFPFDVAGESVKASPKIGIAIAPADGATADAVVDAAAGALERARRSVATTRFANAAVTEKLEKRRELEDAIRRGLDTNQFSLAFLPIVDLATGAVIGAEALLRWRHPDRGEIPPLEFIPLADETGLMVPVGTWVVREALRSAARWNAAGSELHVAVNVTARQLHAPGFTRQLQAAIVASGCKPEWLEIELTEGTAMQHAATVQMLLSEIRGMRVRVALDDFGTGYSSMAFLKSLPADIIKIDRTFVDGVPHDNSDSSIVRALVAFALCTGREVRAEGVTSIEQARWLHAEGCDAAQGFFFAKPIPSDEFEAWLAAYRAESPEPDA